MVMKNPLSELMGHSAIQTKAGGAVDCSAWIGTYPFRAIPRSSIDDLRERMQVLGIDRAIVSPFEALFQENNLDSYAHAAAQLKSDPGLEVWPVIRPGALHGFEKLLDEYRPGGMRLVPNYHGYRLYDRTVERIMAAARERRMMVQIFTRIADERWHWMLKVPELSLAEIEHAVSIYGNQPLLISGLNAPQNLSPRMQQHPGLFADVSRVRGPLFAMEKLLASSVSEKLVFGSLWPIQIIEPTLWQITSAPVPDEKKNAVLHTNAKTLLNRCDL
jgi:uncharacterized protein